MQHTAAARSRLEFDLLRTASAAMTIEEDPTAVPGGHGGISIGGCGGSEVPSGVSAGGFGVFGGSKSPNLNSSRGMQRFLRNPSYSASLDINLAVVYPSANLLWLF